MLFFAAGALGVLLASAFVIAIANQNVTPDQLYERIRKTAATNLYDPARLPDWDRWQARHTEPFKDHADARRLANEMLHELNDPYTMALGPKELNDQIIWESSEFVGIGVSISAAYENTTQESCEINSAGTGVSCKYPTLVRVIYNSPAAKAGLKAGDFIVSINGKPMAGALLADVVKELHGKNRTTVSLVIESGGIEREVTLTRSFVSHPTAFSQVVADGVGYLRISHFRDAVDQAVLDELPRLASCSSLIIDVRDNPGGWVHTSIRLAALFIKDGHVTTTETRVPGSPEKPRYVTTEYRVTDSGLSERRGNRAPEKMDTGRIDLWRQLVRDKQLVILANENTASAAELFAGALHDTAHATIIGAKTFGKGISQVTLNLPNRTQLRVTQGKYFLPSGYWPGNGSQDKRGIAPDIAVELKSKVFDFGKPGDKQFEAALAFLKQKSA